MYYYTIHIIYDCNNDKVVTYDFQLDALTIHIECFIKINVHAVLVLLLSKFNKLTRGLDKVNRVNSSIDQCSQLLHLSLVVLFQ